MTIVHFIKKISYLIFSQFNSSSTNFYFSLMGNICHCFIISVLFREIFPHLRPMNRNTVICFYPKVWKIYVIWYYSNNSNNHIFLQCKIQQKFVLSPLFVAMPRWQRVRWKVSGECWKTFQARPESGWPHSPTMQWPGFSHMTSNIIGRRWEVAILSIAQE